MALQRRPGKSRQKLFEWKVIKISYVSLQFWIFVVVFLSGAFAVYQYRGLIKEGEVRAREAVVNVLKKIGISFVDRQTGTDEQVAEVIERRYAALSYFDGEVKIQRAMELNWEDARMKMRLATGDRVRTYDGARAEVLFDDGSVLRIKPDSLIVIGDLTENLRTKVRQSSVRLMVSNIEADIKKSVVEGSQFRLEMPSAVAEIDRAKVNVQVGPTEESSIKVLSGKVKVDTGLEKLDLTDLTQVSIRASKEISQISGIISAPTVLAPDNLGKLYFSDPEEGAIIFKWEKIGDAKGYNLQISHDRRFIKSVFEKRNISDASFRVSGLLPGVYYGRVWAIDKLGFDGSFSEPRAFMIILDRYPPEVEIKKFVSLKAAGGYNIYVEGSTEPTADVSLAGREAVVDERGQFSASVQGISLQRKEVLLQVRDHVGNVTRMPLKIISKG